MPASKFLQISRSKSLQYAGQKACNMLTSYGAAAAGLRPVKSLQIAAG
jgi:hypothetical protein